MAGGDEADSDGLYPPMKRMITCALIALAGLLVCGLLVLRHACRTAPELPDDSGLPAPTGRDRLLIDRWQGDLQVDTRTDYTSDPETTKRLLEKLRQEELRQRPQEGRN